MSHAQTLPEREGRKAKTLLAEQWHTGCGTWGSGTGGQAASGPSTVRGQMRLKIRQALWPPKPNELLIA